ncbi:MAG: 4-(cytidine 5'-diphospho)-2-C-methyl-D-erythritol kinase [Alphaproteobacteria bacterium]
MSATDTRSLNVFAPAKVNLYLHVTGRLDNGYHTLDSLVAFTDIGDQIEITPAPEFQFSIDGPYAKGFSPKEIDHSPDSSNLVVQAAWALARMAQKIPSVHIRLTKNLPLASGLGGGSSDAAAVIWGLLEWWKLPRDTQGLQSLMTRLGADVPACFSCRPSRLRGIGDILDPTPPMGEVPIILINPGKPCMTADVFSRFTGGFREPVALPKNLETLNDLLGFLDKQNNDLLKPALDTVPEIKNVLQSLSASKSCLLSRMTGSGASCFGLFKTQEEAKETAKKIQNDKPGWWIKSGWLNRPERY